jgi:hypothetical protein
METAMNLNNLIDLIAEVAAKRIAREGETKAEPPGEVTLHSPLILAILFGVPPLKWSTNWDSIMPF